MARLQMRKFLIIFAVLFLLAPMARAADPSPDGAEFFEKKIRPLLAENCYKCHSASAQKLKGGFRLDAKDLALKGGESGKLAIVPGQPEKSLLIEAVGHNKTDPQKPPKKNQAPTPVDDP